MKYETATHTLPPFLVPPAVGCFSWPECKNTEASSLCYVWWKQSMHHGDWRRGNYQRFHLFSENYVCVCLQNTFIYTVIAMLQNFVKLNSVELTSFIL